MAERAPWTRWRQDEVEALRRLAGQHTVEQIAETLGRTVEQVRGKAKAVPINLALRGAARAQANARISAAVSKAWRDPEKRARIMDGMWSRPLAGAALGGPRSPQDVRVHDRSVLHADPVYAAAHAAAPRGLRPEEREDLVADLVVLALEGAPLDSLAARADAVLRYPRLSTGPMTLSLDAPLYAGARMTLGDLVTSEMEHV